jgi:hypothetical protein
MINQNKSREEFIMSCVQEHYDEAVSLGYEVVAVFLQGSQNYCCDIYTEEYRSDVDTKAIILPSLDDIVRGSSPFSHTHVRANNEHIDIKDIRVMFENFRKQNSSYLEILFTDFKIINPKYEALMAELLSQAENIARAHPNQALRCFSGMSMEKLKALTHPYPSIKDKIDKFGYDPKQLHHILRLNEFVKRYIAGESFKDCLKPTNINYLVDIKLGILPLEEAKALAVNVDQETKELVLLSKTEEEIINQEVVDFLTELKVKFIKQFLSEELRNAEV